MTKRWAAAPPRRRAKKEGKCPKCRIEWVGMNLRPPFEASNFGGSAVRSLARSLVNERLFRLTESSWKSREGGEGREEERERGRDHHPSLPLNTLFHLIALILIAREGGRVRGGTGDKTEKDSGKPRELRSAR